MSDIEQGDFAKIPLNPGDVYRVTTSGVATMQGLSGAPSSTTTVTANSQAFGPYNVNAVVKVTATSGKCSVSLVTNEPVVFDPSTGLIPAGPGRDAVVEAAGAAFLGGRAAAIGDSITAYGAGSWFHQLCLKSGGMIRRAVNAGVAGNTSTQMAARIVTDLPTALRLDIAFVGTAGTNDVTSSISDVVTWRNIYGMCLYLRSIGTKPVIVLMPPRSESPSSRTAAIAKRMHITAKAAEYGELLIDPWIDYVGPDGGWQAGADNGDGIHPSQATANGAADKAWSLLRGMVLPAWNGMHSMTGLPGALITTNDFLADTGMDGSPDGWSGYALNGLVVTKTTTAGDIGNVWRISTLGLNGSGTVVAGERVEERVIAGLTLTAGRRIAVSAKVSLAGYSSGIKCYVRANPNGGADAIALEPVNFFGDLQNAVVYGEGIVNGSGSTQVTIQFRLVTTGTSTPSVGFAELSQIQVWDLTAAGIA